MVKIKNTKTKWGIISIIIHWLSALVIVALFTLGLWMVDLNYYHSWYQKAPDLHQSIGILLFIVTLLRLLWLWFSPKPKALNNHKKWEVILAKITHKMFYLALLMIMFSGYLIVTADGRSLSVFDWFELPAIVDGIDNLEDIAGDIHYYLAIFVIVLASVHALAALKHHFLDKDKTLTRMLTK